MLPVINITSYNETANVVNATVVSESHLFDLVGLSVILGPAYLLITIVYMTCCCNSRHKPPSLSFSRSASYTVTHTFSDSTRSRSLPSSPSILTGHTKVLASPNDLQPKPDISAADDYVNSVSFSFQEKEINGGTLTRPNVSQKVETDNVKINVELEEEKSVGGEQSHYVSLFDTLSEEKNIASLQNVYLLNSLTGELEKVNSDYVCLFDTLPEQNDTFYSVLPSICLPVKLNYVNSVCIISPDDSPVSLENDNTDSVQPDNYKLEQSDYVYSDCVQPDLCLPAQIKSVSPDCPLEQSDYVNHDRDHLDHSPLEHSDYINSQCVHPDLCPPVQSESVDPDCVQIDHCLLEQSDYVNSESITSLVSII